MKGIKFSIVYDYDRRGDLRKDGTAAVLIRAYYDRKNRFFNTGIYITPKQWHGKYSRVVHHPNQFKLNQTIQAFLAKMEAFDHEVMRRDGQVSVDRLKAYMESGEEASTFTEFYQEHLEKERHRLAASTHLDQTQTFEKLIAFKSEVFFSELTPAFLDRFIKELFAQGMEQNTVHKHYKNLRKYINLAVKYGHLEPGKNPCKQVSVKPHATDRLYLTEHELKAFESFKTPPKKEHWQSVLDFFLFTCYTGLRFSDVAAIEEEHILETPEGIELFLTAQKTDKPYRQNLRKLFPSKDGKESRPEKIIRRRLDALLFPDDPLFYHTCRNSYVKQLKQIAKTLPVRERVKVEIASHTGRHTFGAIMAGIVDVHFLQKLMQHSKIRETMVYVHLNRKMIDKALDKAKWF